MTHLTLEDYQTSGRRRELQRGRRRPPALGRGDRGRRAGARPAGQRRQSPKRKVSLRATDDRIDVSQIARSLGGGGHRRAAGFSTDLDFPELVQFLRGALAEQLVALDGRVILVDKPAGVTSHDVVAAQRRAAAGRGAKVGPRRARWTRSRPGLLLILVGPRDAGPALPDGARKRYETVARLGFDLHHRRPGGRARAGPDAADLSAAPDGHDPPAPARVLGRRRSAASARTSWRAAARTVEIPEREVHVYRFELLWRDDDRAAFAIDCSSGTYVRSLIADLRRRLLRGAAAHRDRPVRRGRRRPRRGSCRSTTRWRSCRRSIWRGEDARRAGHGVAFAGARTPPCASATRTA